MIKVERVSKENGEITPTRKHPFEVADHDELEKERAKLEKHYKCRIYFTRKEKEPGTDESKPYKGFGYDVGRESPVTKNDFGYSAGNYNNSKKQSNEK